jgi:hypothetical protein
MDLIDEIKFIGFPCTYGSFKSQPPIPFVTVQLAYNNDMIADNHNYKDIGNYQLEYYNSIKYPPDEQKIENKLKELRLPYSKVESFLDSEDLYQIIYEIQLI